MLRVVKLNASKRKEMAVESEGRQPVVAMKQGNACGAKGHSQINLSTTN